MTAEKARKWVEDSIKELTGKDLTKEESKERETMRRTKSQIKNDKMNISGIC